MSGKPDFECAAETGRLLAELDRVLERSNAMRDLLRRHEQLRDLERITGPSPKTRSLRRELMLDEQRLSESGDSDANAASPCSLA